MKGGTRGRRGEQQERREWNESRAEGAEGPPGCADGPGRREARGQRGGAWPGGRVAASLIPHPGLRAGSPLSCCCHSSLALDFTLIISPLAFHQGLHYPGLGTPSQNPRQACPPHLLHPRRLLSAQPLPPLHTHPHPSPGPHAQLHPQGADGTSWRLHRSRRPLIFLPSAIAGVLRELDWGHREASGAKLCTPLRGG